MLPQGVFACSVFVIACPNWSAEYFGKYPSRASSTQSCSGVVPDFIAHVVNDGVVAFCRISFREKPPDLTPARNFACPDLLALGIVQVVKKVIEVLLVLNFLNDAVVGQETICSNPVENAVIFNDALAGQDRRLLRDQVVFPVNGGIANLRGLVRHPDHRVQCPKQSCRGGCSTPYRQAFDHLGGGHVVLVGVG